MSPETLPVFSCPYLHLLRLIHALSSLLLGASPSLCQDWAGPMVPPGSWNSFGGSGAVVSTSEEEHCLSVITPTPEPLSEPTGH